MRAFKKMQSFDGSGDLERWLDRFDFCIKIDEIEEKKEAHYLAMLLEGPAYDVWKNLADAAKEDAKLVKAALRQVYGIKRMQAWRAATNRLAYPGEPPDQVGEEIRKHVNIALSGGDARDAVTAFLLLDALSPDIRERILLEVDEGDLSYDKVMTLARRLVSNKMTGGYVGEKLSPEQTFTSSRGRSQGPESARQPVFPRTAEMDDTAAQTLNVQGRKSLIKCFCCGRVGHVRKECLVQCYECGKNGHKRHECHAKPSAVHLNSKVGANAPESV